MNETNLNETISKHMKGAGLLFLIAAFAILIANFMMSYVALIIFLVIGLLMLLGAIIFLVLILTNVGHLKPDASTPVNIARVGLILYILILITINILGLTVFPGVATIVLAVFQAITMFAGFFALNLAFKRFSEMLDPSNKIDSPAYVIYSLYGVLTFLLALIAGLVGTYGAILAVLIIDLIISTILMLTIAIILLLGSEKIMKHLRGEVAAPAITTEDQPSAKYYAEYGTQEQIFTCNNCGKQIDESDTFCSECGAKLT
jgi:hypothetical protein